jgi:UV DNA damage endonuclease
MQLREPKKYGLLGESIFTSRKMIKKTFIENGMDYVDELSLKNISDLDKIMDWNIQNNIKLFRISSNLFPWQSEYNWKDLKSLDLIKTNFKKIGDKAKENNIRLTFHPDHFTILCSPKDQVVKNAIKSLKDHADIFDFMGFNPSHYNKINIHVGGAYGNKQSAMERFCDNFKKLPNNVKKRLTVENDDKESMFSTKDLYEGVYMKIGIPIVFDYHHHSLCTGGLSTQDALNLAVSTWPKDIVPVVHYSESRVLEKNDKSIKPQAHSDYIYNKVNSYGNDIDIMFEAKHKELALLKYIKNFK